MKNSFFRMIFFNLAILHMLSCSYNREQATIEAALNDAGPNRAELQKVLDHYAAPADSLQLRAARFLIANMPWHFGYYGEEMNKYGRIFAIIDTLSYRKENVSIQDKMFIGDSLLKVYGAPRQERTIKIPDTRMVTADYLITNIDFAVRAWRTAPWGREVSFADFCDFILPYRIRNEQLQYWRPSCYYEYSRMAGHYQYPDSMLCIFNGMNWDLVTENTFTMYFNKYFPFPKSFNDVIRGKIGGCETTTFFSATAMMAAGLPVASDFIPQWGNINSGHYMLHLMGQKREQPLITNENKPVNTWSLVEWSSLNDTHRHLFTPEELPPGMNIEYVSTIPKIYRYTFSHDSTLASINHSIGEKDICPEFRSSNFKDVTSEYVQCSDFRLRTGPSLRKFRLAYLCNFDVNGWKPVAVSRISGDTALFKNIGREVIYLPSVFYKGVSRPAGKPFFLDSAGIPHMLEKRPGRQDMHLVRKTALFPYTVYHSEVVKGGKFEGSDDAGFSHPVLLDSIEKYPFYMTEVEIRNPKFYRYLRYVAPHTEIQESDNIAEVQFYEAGSGKALEGSFIGSEGSPGHEIAKAFDNDMNSYYENKAYKNGWIGIDLGADSKAKVSRIRFCPRNDTNCIIPGDEYELFYWDDGWISLGIQKAVSDHLDYHNMPAGTLFWLRDNTGGHEERIFTYEQGMQRWW